VVQINSVNLLMENVQQPPVKQAGRETNATKKCAQIQQNTALDVIRLALPRVLIKNVKQRPATAWVAKIIIGD
ncbi:MAG: hypothetical protein QF704_18060, partial [Anaerolineales bacterium]|nr:hypothetical protein [Anaerolineales bacterium]